MKLIEKISSVFYSVVGWCTWLGVIALLVFMTVLFATGHSRPATVYTGDVTVVQVSADEAVLTDAGIRCTGEVYRADFSVHIDGAKMSPYKYSAKGIKLNSPLTVGDEKLVCFSGDGVKNSEITYSKLSPADFTVSVYVENPDASADTIAAAVKNAGFCLTDMQLHFSLLDIDVKAAEESPKK